LSCRLLLPGREAKGRADPHGRVRRQRHQGSWLTARPADGRICSANKPYTLKPWINEAAARHAMNHRIENGTLVIEVTLEERAVLNERMAEPGFDSDQMMHEVLEWLVTNDKFTWIDPAVTGDLTSAPMLAILGDEQPGPDDTDEALGTGLV